MEIDKIYNIDCLEGMKHIPDGSIDAIICDLPYGTVKGMAIAGWKNKGDICQWDDQIPTEPLMEQYTRILRQNGVAILFSQEPYTHELRSYGNSGFRFVYPLVWIKNNFANAFSSDKAPVSYFEDLSVFRKIYDMSNQNPLRDYSLKVLEFIGKPRREIIDKVGQCVDHFFRHSSSQFAIPTPETYAELIKLYGIDKMPGFKTYAELEQSGITFNLPEGKNCWNNLQTNGLSLNEEWCAFLKKESFDVGLSIDGTKLIHDTYRKDASGKDTYDRIKENIQLLKRYGIRPDLLCTVNRMTCEDPYGVYHSLKDLDTGWLQFIPIVNFKKDGTLDEDSVDVKAYGDFLHSIFHLSHFTIVKCGQYPVKAQQS